ncbi:MAG: RNA polymerase factor sigma-54 [Spirochaetaceae bacterium]|jgi:RNA polymerase sigma-54 factor|nr:RNA polymerase factor sigma-54 [Spirochaetaceae bacterium]
MAVYQGASLAQELRLSQKMSLKQTQSLDLLQMPLVDLRQKIQAELEQNPALEVLEENAPVSLEDIYKGDNEADAYFESSSDAGFLRGTPGDALSDENRRFIEGALCRPETLQEGLLWQLRLNPAGADTLAAGEILIQNLDADGFNIVPLEQLCASPAFAGERLAAALDEAAALVRRLEPVGCCTGGYMESLSVQAEILYAEEAAGIQKLLPFLEELEKGRFAAVAKKTGCDEKTAAELFMLIKSLSPFPGRAFEGAGGLQETSRYVIPDIQIIYQNDEFKIILNDEEIPVLGIAPFFMEQKLKNGPARNFVEENIKEARWFIYAVNRRNHTLLRVTRAVVEFQKKFFQYGPKFLAPLTLHDIAAELGIHEATVSRTANGKYAQTEWGIFELRRFFTNSISGAGSTGSRYSKEAVKEIIKEIISAENGTLSDMAITKSLKERGIDLARRTVAKYRTELDLGSSYSRHTHA